MEHAEFLINNNNNNNNQVQLSQCTTINNRSEFLTDELSNELRLA